jgi:hypothetical protein
MGNIAVDSITFNEGDCPVSNECDFETSDLCGYLNDVGSKLLWIREQGNAADTDHSYGTETGHFMKVSSISPHVKDQIARLISKSYPSAKICVKFWYKTLGSIRFNVRTYAFGVYSNKVFFASYGDRGNEWSLGQANLASTTAFQIVFEVIDQGPLNPDGFVYLDDIEINFKECQPLGSCNFEDGYCGFTNLISDTNWVIISGEYSSNNILSVPSEDHTYGSLLGHFIYLDTTFNKPGTKALLESEVIADFMNSSKCVRLYVKTKDNVATLNINRKNKLNGQIENLLAFNGYQSDYWIMKELQLVNASFASTSMNSYPYSFLIEGIVGETKGQLAVDDVELYGGVCNGTSVGPTQFDCQDGQVIDIKLVCDFKNDCLNGMDERQCGNCGFENENLCNWKEISTGFYKWKRMQNGSIFENPGPSIDHTYYNQSGM